MIPVPTRYAWLLALPLAAAVIAHGGRTPIEWNLCVAAIGAMSLVYWYVARPGSQGRDPGLEAQPGLLALLAPAYVAFQMLPLPLPLLRLLSHRRAEIADALGDVMARPWFAPISVEPASTATALVLVMTCVLCFLFVRDITSQSLRRRSWATVFPLLAIGAFEGGVALWQAWSGTEVQGTYWNRNHLAGFLEMVLPLAVAFAAYSMRRDANARPATTSRGMAWSLVGGVVMPMMAVLIIFLGVLASASKMGYVAALGGLLAMAFVATLTRLSGVARWAVIGALPVLAIAGFVLLANQDVLIRLASVLDSPDGLTGEGRLPIWADSLRVFAAYPLFGSGLGTYLTAFLSYQTTSIDYHWTHAHNDYLELATDLGMVGIAALGALTIAIVDRALRLVRTVRRSGADLVALGCLGACAAIGLHSLVDFNLYIPANALLLSWIAGIAAGIPPRAAGQVTVPTPSYVARAGLQARERGLETQAALRFAAVGMACVILVMAARAIVAADEAATSEGEAAVLPTLDQQLEAVRSSPASPYAWLDLAESFIAAGRTTEAKASVSNALALSARVPPVIRRAATLLDQLGDHRHAVTLMSRELQQAGTDPGEVFDWFVERRIPTADVLAGLSKDGRTLPAYLRYLMLPGTCDDAALAWRDLVDHHRPAGQLAIDYMNFVRSDCQQPDAAAQAWVDYARQSSPGYRLSDWVFNGDFERDPLSVSSDWQWNARSDAAKATLDAGQKFAGTRSLRMLFRGKSQANYDGASQDVVVSPGVYQFTAAMKTLGLKSADGIRFRIWGSSPGSRLEMLTEQVMGTTNWRAITAEVVIPDGMTMIRIQVVRRPGPGAEKENDLDGTAWVDAITLSRIGSTGPK